jgi:tryptophan 2,3-dioxygenase
MAAYNDRGVIAENYYDLQGLGVLDAARAANPLPKASPESTLRTLFQAVEIALLNLADVMGRAAADVERGAPGSATVKLFWARGFHRILVCLSLMPQQLALSADGDGPRRVLRVRESPAFDEYLQVLGRFDRGVLHRIASGDLPFETALADRSLDSAEFNLIHLARICNHESTIWERNLAEVCVPAAVPSYAEFVVAGSMRDAVYERVLTGDTYFTQFRGLHQIPETLAEEVNDRLEQAVRDIRSAQLPRALEHLNCVDVLAQGMLASVAAMADNLATSDYHQIRENLGLTSGSHSVSLRFHLFTHLYEQLWEELAGHMLGRPVGDCAEDAIQEAIRQVDRRRFDDAHAWLVHLLLDQCLKLRAHIAQWREWHLHMPRNNLGGELTKSLTGSPAAVRAVEQMRDAARTRDPMLLLARARALVDERPEPSSAPLTDYLASESSLDGRILATTGLVTQRRFHDVQERLGYFANRAQFAPPPRRRA